MTPVELAEMMEGANWRSSQEWERVAWQTSHLLNISGKSMKKSISADKLLGRHKKLQTQGDRVLGFEEILRRNEALTDGV